MPGNFRITACRATAPHPVGRPAAGGFPAGYHGPSRAERILQDLRSIRVSPPENHKAMNEEQSGANGVSPHAPGGLLVPPSPLSAYEQAQIDSIARWKSTESSRLSQMVELVSVPISWGVRRMVPAEVVRQAIGLLERLAERKRGTGSAGDVAERRRLSLEECDRLAAEAIQQAERMSASRGLILRQVRNAVIGHLPFQLVTAMAAITRIGHCYGYPLDRPLDRAVLLDVLELALIENPGRRLRLLEKMHAALDAPEGSGLDVKEIAAAAGRDVLADELADGIVARIPLVGGVIGFIGDRTFVQTAGEAAVRFFQERRLRDEGKVAGIPPSANRYRRSSINEVGRALGETAYAGGAIIGFTATLPVYALGRLVGRFRGPLVSGAVAGGLQAAADAQQFWDGAVNIGSVMPAATVDIAPA